MKIKIHCTFWLLSFVFLFSGLHWELVLFLLIILLHESGHIIMCLLYKQKVKKLNITAFGGLLEAEINNLSFGKELSVYLAGIAVNCLLLFIGRYLSNAYYQTLIINYNLIVIVFNLLPIHPLDGYRVVELLLGKIINQPFREQKILLLLSSAALFVFSYFLFKIKSIAFLVLFVYLFYRNIVYHSQNRQIALKKYVSRYKKIKTKSI